MSSIHPFKIEIADDLLGDLKRRLRATRWPERELVSDWSQGAPLAWIDANRHPVADRRHGLAPGRLVQELAGVLGAHVAGRGVQSQQMVVFDGHSRRDQSLRRIRTKGLSPARVPSVQRQVHGGRGGRKRIIGVGWRRPGHRGSVPRLAGTDKASAGLDGR